IKSLPIEGVQIAQFASRAATLLEENLEKVREMLKEEASDLCKPAEDTPLPPLRAINHRIPLKDESITLPYIPSRCPQAFREQWEKKRDAYLKTGRWKYETGPSAVPILFIAKKPGPNGEKRLRTVFAKQRLNDNTIKLSSPLPDIQNILETVAQFKYKSLIDGRDAYEQIRVDPKDVQKTLFNTPDGTMVSYVMQQGDTNAGATYQTLMNHIFASFIGIFMFVYLDDIIIFSNTVEDHVKHIRLVLDVLRKEKLYLSSSDKLQFFARPLVILGHVIDDKGIKMDPHKVDRISNWKTPTNATLVAGFTGMNRIGTALGPVSYFQRPVFR
ncbi:4465_t:CDS:1, partial [Acaulospora colombiana]